MSRGSARDRVLSSRRDDTAVRARGDRVRGVGPLGVVPSGLASPAAAGVGLATAAYLSVFLSITDVVGGSGRLALAALAALAAGVALARTIDERTALKVAAGLLALGFAGYYLAIPPGQRALLSVRLVALDTVSLLTGLSVLRLALADVWALSVVPVPTFLVAYLASRGRHVVAAAVAGGTLGFLVLTGDAGSAATLAGVVGVAAATGLSTLSAPGGLRSRGSALAVLLAVMVVASATVTVIPAGGADPWGAGQRTPGLESSLTGEGELEVVGATRLSPEVRFTARSTRSANWHAAAYDTYTGDGWVRTGEAEPIGGRIDGPPGDADPVLASIAPETELGTLPAPWKAVAVSGAPGEATVDDQGTIRPGEPLSPGDRVTVESRVPDASPDALRDAGTDYDPDLRDRYTQLPESTPDRVGERTAEIVADAGTNYDRAVAIEEHLEANKEYSLSVQRPDGDVADGFLFEMDAGYCTYFATTMVAMLRTQDVPARLATGYSSGERVDGDEWVVRGQDAHAWVQVYFPEHGWIEFDPTPSAPREDARETRLEEARAVGSEGVDTAETAPEEQPSDEAPADESPDDPASTPDDEPPSTPDDPASTETGTEAAGNGSAGAAPPPGAIEAEDGGGAGANGGEGEGSPLPSRETIGYALLAFLVAIAGAHHAGATNRVAREVGIRLPARRRDPTADAERAFADLEYLLARRYRARRPGETPRDYLDSLRIRGVDERVHAVGEAYERAVYAGDVSRAEADEARRTVRRLALSATPVIGRLFDGS